MGVMAKRLSMAPKQFVFVLMPFDEKFKDIYTYGIKGAAEEVGAYAERLDEQLYAEGMLDRIFNQISKADVIVADMTGKNPNVFYEVGYAHALGKLVILLTQDSADIPFDLKHRSHIVYAGKIESLREDLKKQLGWALNEVKVRGGRERYEHFAVAINATPIPEMDAQNPSQHVPIITAKGSGRLLRLSMSLRNESMETSSAVTHIYALVPESAGLTPCTIVLGTIGTSTFNLQGYQSVFETPIERIGATMSDPLLGICSQYRLPSSLPSLPPMAIDQVTIEFKIGEEQSKIDAIIKIRMHFEAEYRDYPFGVSLTIEPSDDHNAS
jgi:hypothetical protein